MNIGGAIFEVILAVACLARAYSFMEIKRTWTGAETMDFIVISITGCTLMVMAVYNSTN